MNCANHPDQLATAFCRDCGKPLCEECQHPAQGTVFCGEHLPAVAGPPPLAPPRLAPPAAPWPGPQPVPDAGVSPGLAFVLGLIPGVGAIYNGQYAKGLVHVIVLGLLISILSSGAAGGLEPLFGLLIALWFFYMAFEAYHTARKRQRGQMVDEFSSLVPLRGRHAGFPVAPVALIAVGALFLLKNLDLLPFQQVMKYWPVFLIALGIYMLYERLTGEGDSNQSGMEASHERR